MIRGVIGPSSGLPKLIPASALVSATGISSESTKASPRRAKSIPRVAMNELIPTLTTKKAFTTPISSPATSASAIPKKMFGTMAMITPRQQGCSHTEVELTHQDDRGQAQSDQADQGHETERHRVGREDGGSVEQGADHEQRQQKDAAPLGPSAEGRPSPCSALVGASPRLMVWVVDITWTPFWPGRRRRRRRRSVSRSRSAASQSRCWRGLARWSGR